MAKRAASAIIAGAGDSTGAALSRLFAEKGLAVHGARRRPPTTHDAAPLSLGSRGGSVTPVVACDFRDEEQVVYKRATLTAEITFYSDCLVFSGLPPPVLTPSVSPRSRFSRGGVGQVEALVARVEAESGPVALAVHNIGANVRFRVADTSPRVYRKT
jgi:NAD(P)-dependent dehydrogenase (short-subunit alcohol dehydrogenase family)